MIQEARAEFLDLIRDGRTDITRVIWWLIKYEDLYQYTDRHRRIHPDIEPGLHCICHSCWENPNKSFCYFYEGLSELSDIYGMRDAASWALKEYEKIGKDDLPALQAWMKRTMEFENHPLVNTFNVIFYDEFYKPLEEGGLNEFPIHIENHTFYLSPEGFHDLFRLNQLYEDLMFEKRVWPEGHRIMGLNIYGPVLYELLFSEKNLN